MKIIKLWGGLGNQLFQYSFGEYLKKVIDKDVVYINQQGKINLDNFAITKFNGFESGAFNHVLPGYLYNYFSGSYRIKRKLLSIAPFLSNRILVENLKRDVSINDLKYQLFDGYWQDLKFIHPIQLELRSKLVFRKSVSFSQSPFWELILNEEHSVSLHIRRGDYLASAYHANLDLNYYHNAVTYFKNNFPKSRFFIFTNDQKWVLENFNFDMNTVFVNHDSLNYPDLLDFHLMSLCKNNIIANSTFSWWAAWLNDNADKIVIAPQKWFNTNNEAASKILPEEWIIM